MKYLVQWIGALALLAVGATAVADQRFEAGRDYIVLDQPVTTARGKVEVREFFAYGCGHCFNFTSPMESWVEHRAPAQVDYVRNPVVFSESWRVLAQAYHVAEMLDVVEQVHLPLFSAIHNDRRRFRDTDDVAAFFAQLGVDRGDFLGALGSFSSDMRMRQSEQAMRSFRVDSTPTVGVAGKYVVTPRTAGSHERMIEIIDHLVRQEARALR